MKFTSVFSIISLAALSACGPVNSANNQEIISEKDAALLAKRLDGRIVGETKKCVTTSRLGQPVVYGSRTILYSGVGRTEYLNTLPVNCPGLDDDDFIVTEIYGSQLCSGEKIKPVDRFSGFSGPICRLGDFIPYTKPKKQS